MAAGLIALSMLGAPGITDAQETVTEDQKVFASQGGEYEFFGFDVASHSDWFVVGAPYEDGYAGAAYVFRNDGTTWQEHQRLSPAGLDPYDIFGGSVANHGDLMAIGAFGDDGGGSSAGAVYVFRFEGSSWAYEAKLVASDPEQNMVFGADVSVSTGGDVGDVIAVAAPGDASSTGATYVFQHDGSAWVESAKIVGDDAVTRDRFGSIVSVSGDVLVATANIQSSTKLGSAYVYRFDGHGWDLEQKIVSPGAIGDYYGLSAAVSGDAVLVGAPRGLYYSGAAYTYRFDSSQPVGEQWVHEDTLSASGTSYFGASVSLCGDTAAVGSTGGAYVYRYDADAWSADLLLTPSTQNGYTAFGYAVAVCETAIVTAPYDGENGLYSGAAYIYGVGGPDNTDTDLDGLPDSLEISLADGALPCLGVNNPDSDGDGLSDGEEVLDLMTSPCDVDSDGDGIPDNIDPLPTDPGGTTDQIEASLRTLAEVIELADVSAFTGNAKSAAGRQGAMASQFRAAAKQAARGNASGAMGHLESILDKLDGDPSPSDWMADDLGDDTTKADIRAEVELQLAILWYLL